MKFKKKPIVIEAFQWPSEDPPSWWHEALTLDSYKTGNAREYLNLPGHTPHARIKTLEGIHRANEGDWIIQGIQGELYPCKPDIFEATYDPVIEG